MNDLGLRSLHTDIFSVVAITRIMTWGLISVSKLDDISMDGRPQFPFRTGPFGRPGPFETVSNLRLIQPVQFTRSLHAQYSAYVWEVNYLIRNEKDRAHAPAGRFVKKALLP